MTTLSRFMSKVTVDESGCWYWIGHVQTSGYAQLGPGWSQRRAHRWAYEHFIGPIPAELEIDHLCHSWDSSCPGGSSCIHRRCVNPRHLEAVTHKTNQSRGLVGKNQPYRPACVNGHSYPEHLYVAPSGRRSGCRTCRLIRSQRQQQRVRASALIGGARDA